MQNENENQGFRKIDRYPRYEIDTWGHVRSIRNKTKAKELKRTRNGYAQVSLYLKGKQYKETIMDLMEETFTAREIMGDEAYEKFIECDDFKVEDEYEKYHNIFDDDYIDSDSSDSCDDQFSDDEYYACDCDIVPFRHAHPN